MSQNVNSPPLSSSSVFRFHLYLCMSCFVAAGCAAPMGGPNGSQGLVSNPIQVMSNNEELIWERTVDVLHDFQFEIARENRLAKVIETAPKVGSGLLEPWQREAVGFHSRLEGSLQSIRRIVQVSLQPNDQQTGYLVNVVAYKEIEDLPGIAANSPGAATFSNESTPLNRDLNPIVGQTSPSLWIPAGRDVALEQAILQKLHTVYSR